MNPSIEAVLGNLVALVAIGMGVAFLIADWRSATSRVLAAFMMSMGATVWTGAGYQLFRDIENLPFLVRISGVATAFTLISGAEWLLRIRRTIPAANLQTRFGDRVIRLGQAAAVVYAILTLVFWRDRAGWVFERLGTVEGLTDPRFFQFAVPFFLSIAASGGVALLTLRRKPDAAEKMRCQCRSLMPAIRFLPALLAWWAPRLSLLSTRNWRGFELEELHQRVRRRRPRAHVEAHQFVLRR